MLVLLLFAQYFLPATHLFLVNPVLSVVLATICCLCSRCRGKIQMPEEYSKHQLPVAVAACHRLQEMIHLSISATPSTKSKVFVQKSPLEIFFFRFSAKISPVEKEHLWIPWTVFTNMRHGNSWFKSDKPDGYSAKYAKGSNSSADVHPGSETEYSREMIVERVV